jgi:hypothetical protein
MIQATMSRTELVFLNIGLNEPLMDIKSWAEVQHRGQVLSLAVYPNGAHATTPKELVGHDYMPVGIDYCRSNGRLYWTHMGQGATNDGALYSMKLDGSDVRTVVKQSDAHTCKQCVVDEDSRKLCFATEKVFGSSVSTLMVHGGRF